MIASKLVPLAPVVLALALAGCGGSPNKEAAAAAYCPTPLAVQDAQRLTRFKPGAGRDPRDVAFEAILVRTDAACSISRNQMEVSVFMQIAVNAGPSVNTGVTQVPFFVRVMDSSGAVVAGRDELADYKLSAASPRGISREELAVKLSFSQLADLGAYRIAVGLKPSPEELQYNRRGTARP